jgi:hypothetical protein
MNATSLKLKAADLIRNAFRHVGKAALAVSLIPLGAIEALSSTIDSTVTSIGNGQYSYSFTLSGVGSFSGSAPGDIWIPLFDASDIANITDPPSWSHSIRTPQIAEWQYDTTLDTGLGTDPVKYGPHPEVFNSPPLVLTWTTFSSYSSVVTGFSFTSRYGSSNAPFVVYAGYETQFVDPPTPNSPARIAAQSPEPTTFLMAVMATAAAAIFGVRRRP